MFYQKICYHHRSVGRKQFVLLCTGNFRFGCFAYVIVFECKYIVSTLHTFAYFLYHIATLLHRGNCRRIRGWATYTKLFKFFYKTRFGISRCMSAEHLLGYKLIEFQVLTNGKWRQYFAVLFFIFVIAGFHIYFQKPFEFYNLTGRNQSAGVGRYTDGGSSFL